MSFCWFTQERQRPRPASDYLAHQPDLNSKMREILVDWLHEVAVRFRFRRETMALAVALVDRFLACKAVGRRRLQLVGCTALFVAGKYHEPRTNTHPNLDALLVISDHAYTRDHLLQMEGILLPAVSFDLAAEVLPLQFLNDFLGAATDNTSVFLAHYLLELTLQYVEFLAYRPSTLAASVLFLAAHQAHAEQATSAAYAWSDHLQRVTQHAVSQLLPCLRDLYAHWYSLTEIATATLVATGAHTAKGLFHLRVDIAGGTRNRSN